MPREHDAVRTAIENVVRGLMDRVLQKVLIQEPFVPEKHHAQKPLYAALVPDEIFKGAHFERRFVTPFGNAWEALAVAVATAAAGGAERNKEIAGKIKAERLRRITETLNRLEHPEQGQSRVKPDWKAELEYVLKGRGEFIPATVVCDLFVEDRNTAQKQAFEIKAPLPNSDQTKVSKEKILKLYAMEPCPIDAAYYALPYNPYGKREDYAWSFPMRWFDMKRDEVVLIGDEFWEKIGGKNAYRLLVETVNEIGGQYKDRIYREYLGIEPPPLSAQGKL
jgi:hypothetical protein